MGQNVTKGDTLCPRKLIQTGQAGPAGSTLKARGHVRSGRKQQARHGVIAIRAAWVLAVAALRSGRLRVVMATLFRRFLLLLRAGCKGAPGGAPEAKEPRRIENCNYRDSGDLASACHAVVATKNRV